MTGVLRPTDDLISGGPRIRESTARIAAEISSGMRAGRTWPLTPAWFDAMAMRWASADPDTRLQLFRFVDVIPMLRSSQDVAEHFRVYFDRTQGNFPLPIRLAAWLAASKASGLVGHVIQRNVVRMAQRFVAGATIDEILECVRDLRSRGLEFTLDVLGEATISEKEADAYQGEYLALLGRLGPECRTWPSHPNWRMEFQTPRLNLSLKVSALYSRFDPIAPDATFAGVTSRLREIVRRARDQGAFLNIDMEQYAYKDLTMSIFRRLFEEPEFRDWPEIGIAMQAYLKDTEGDLHELLDWVKARGTPITVRIVKGAYWDYETLVARHRHWPIPVYTEKWQSDACFARCATFLLENRQWLRPAIASHNVVSLAHALAVAESIGAPRGSYELQMLYGMGDPLAPPLVQRGEQVRIYAPYGRLLPGMAYLVRRLLENSSNTSILNQSVAFGGIQVDLDNFERRCLPPEQ